MSAKAPVAVLRAPLCASVNGTATSCVAPLIVSLPAASNLPPPRAFTALDWNVACGNLAALNHAALGTSASVSGDPKLALAVSILNAICAACGLAGSNATLASNFLKRPSTGTPICLLTKTISLRAASSFC